MGGGVPEAAQNHVPKDWALEIISEEEWNLLKELEEN